MKCIVSWSEVAAVVVVFSLALIQPCQCQREPSLPINMDSFNQIIRSTIPVLQGRFANVKDLIIRFYGSNSTKPSSSYRLRAAKLMLAEPRFDSSKPTVLYTHGYVELITDKSVRSIVRAYNQHGGYNVLVLDWSNMAFGNYLSVALDIPSIGKETGSALLRLVKRGLSVPTLHLVGHSLGAHVLAYAARYLAKNGLVVTRLTGLDPAYPGYYPPLLGSPISPSDASFVDIIHTDGGGYGTPTHSGHVDFWPNEGGAKQPGCFTATVPLTVEDFCSHWRSWAFWAESVVGGEFVARQCGDYDTFLRRRCQDAPLARMGLQATSEFAFDHILPDVKQLSNKQLSDTTK